MRPPRRNYTLTCVRALVWLSLGSWAHTGWAQEETENIGARVNYVYAAQLRFGAYKLGGLSVQVYQLPLAYTFQLGKDQGWELKVKMPVLYGHYRFKTTLNAGDQQIKLSKKLDSLSVVPGIELHIPLSDRWLLKPFAEWGPLKDLSGGPWNHVYAIGVRSLVSYGWKRFQFTLGNALLYAGNATFSGDEEESYGTLETGIEVRHPLGFAIKGYAPDIGGFFAHYHFFPAAEFTRLRQGPLKLHNQYEFGFSLGSEPSWKLWIIRAPRVGVSYRFGGLDAVRVNFGFPF
jgi:hypothetical protein